MVWQFVGAISTSNGFQHPIPGEVMPNATAPNNNDAAAVGILLTTYIDPTSGQPYGRYIINETVPVVEYEYRPVVEQIYLPETVTEPRTTSVPQYIPVWSQQLQLQNVPNWNPFSPPQQVWRYVPVVQYQTNYVPVTQNFTFQKYEKKEVTKMVPVVSSQSKRVPKVVDRPLGQLPSGGNTIAVSPFNANPYQQAAQIAQANRNSRFPTRPIGPVYGYHPGRNLLAQTPAPFYPNYSGPSTNPAATYVPNRLVASGSASLPSTNNNIVIPAVPLRPEPNNMAGYNGYAANPYAPAYPPVYPYTNTASRPPFNWPSFASGTGTLFGSSLFSNSRNTQYVASNTPVTQPYVWGNNINSNPSGLSFRPNTSPYAVPQQNWGMVPSNTYRDPMQGGMPATVMR